LLVIFYNNTDIPFNSPNIYFNKRKQKERPYASKVIFCLYRIYKQEIEK
jgi:hypothetical protein